MVGFEDNLYATSESIGTVQICVELQWLPTGGLETSLVVDISLLSSAKASKIRKIPAIQHYYYDGRLC